MYFSFQIDLPGLERTAFLFERANLDASGDLETGFLDRAGPVARHRDRGLGHVAATLVESLDIEVLAISRNPVLVLDEGLPDRIAEAVAMLAPLHGRWSLAAGGLTTGGARVCALYNSLNHFIPINTSPRPLTDPLTDLYLVDAAWLRSLLARSRALPDAGFESVVVTQGYLDGRVALFAPALVAGIDGDLRPRDPVKLRHDLNDWFGDSLAGDEVPSVMGPVAIERSGPHHAADPRAPLPAQDLAEATDRVIEHHCAPLSLSIVTRTRFDRPHLLERLLSSITRARHDRTEIEVVLSSDADLVTCEVALGELEARFVNLPLRLQHNAPRGHSRVTNLLAGLRAASNTHVAIMDDDDYVDVFAFQEMHRALFLGARPLMVTSTHVHEEDWVATPRGRNILARSIERAGYPAAGWREMFGGANRLPVCALVMPRVPLIARLDAFAFEHDLSEDYALFLLLLTDPALPEIVELLGTFGHVSLRPKEGHSITVEDRRPWARDIALYLADLTRNQAVAGPGNWAILTQRGDHTAEAALRAKTEAELRTALAAREREIRLMKSEIARLRADNVAAGPSAAPAVAKGEAA